MDAEPRMLIGGKLVDGAVYDNINPATEQVIGEAADAADRDVDAAAAAARTAFDETSWATDPAFRVRCLRQLQSGVGRESGVAGFEEYLETKGIAEPA